MRERYTEKDAGNRNNVKTSITRKYAPKVTTDYDVIMSTRDPYSRACAAAL